MCVFAAIWEEGWRRDEDKKMSWSLICIDTTHKHMNTHIVLHQFSVVCVVFLLSSNRPRGVDAHSQLFVMMAYWSNKHAHLNSQRLTQHIVTHTLVETHTVWSHHYSKLQPPPAPEWLTNQTNTNHHDVWEERDASIKTIYTLSHKHTCLQWWAGFLCYRCRLTD